MLVRRKYIAKCNDCDWKERFPDLFNANRALKEHFDSHPDKDLPVGGELIYREIGRNE